MLGKVFNEGGGGFFQNIWRIYTPGLFLCHLYSFIQVIEYSICLFFILFQTFSWPLRSSDSKWPSSSPPPPTHHQQPPHSHVLGRLRRQHGGPGLRLRRPLRHQRGHRLAQRRHQQGHHGRRRRDEDDHRLHQGRQLRHGKLQDGRGQVLAAEARARRVCAREEQWRRQAHLLRPPVQAVRRRGNHDGPRGEGRGRRCG